MRNIFILLTVCLCYLDGYSQSIADLTRMAEERKNPLYAFSYVGDFYNGLAIAKKQAEDGMKVYTGVIDEDGNIYVSFIYDYLKLEKKCATYKENIYICKRDGKYGFVNSENNEILPCKYTQLINVAYSKWYKVRKDDKYGYVELNEAKSTVQEVIPCIYDKLDLYSDGLIRATYLGLEGILDKNNKPIVPFEFSNISTPHNDMVWVERSGKHGIYDFNGKELQSCDIDEVFTYSNNLRCAVSYDKGPVFPNSNIYIIRDGKMGTMNSSCETIVPCEYQHITSFIERKAFCKKNEKWGIVSDDGEVVQPCVFNKILSNEEIVSIGNLPSNIFTTYLYVQKETKWGMLNTNGTTFIETKYDSIGNFHDGMLLTKRDSIYFYIRENGQEAILCKYQHAYDFSDGLAAVKDKKDKYLFINKQGNIVIKPAKYDKVGVFIDGTCEVSRNGKTWKIDKQGKKVQKKVSETKKSTMRRLNMRNFL